MARKNPRTHAIGGRHGARCGELLALLNEYIDGEVDPSLCKALENTWPSAIRAGSWWTMCARPSPCTARMNLATCLQGSEAACMPPFATAGRRPAMAKSAAKAGKPGFCGVKRGTRLPGPISCNLLQPRGSNPSSGNNKATGRTEP